MKILKTAFLSIITLIAFTQLKAQDVNAPINKVLANYLDVKNALVASDGAVAENKAKQLFTSIGEVPVKGMSAAQKSVWANYTDKLQFDSRHISETTAVPHQREHFASLSKNMFEVIKAFKVNTVEVYQQYCPMKKAYWLSETSEIKNPYYGSNMLDCGKTTETLKPAIK